MEAAVEDVGIKVMQWVSARCPIQKPKKVRARPAVIAPQPHAFAGHKLVLGALTDKPMSPREVSKAIGRSLNRTETVLRELGSSGEVLVFAGRPVRYARKA